MFDRAMVLRSIGLLTVRYSSPLEPKTGYRHSVEILAFLTHCLFFRKAYRVRFCYGYRVTFVREQQVMQLIGKRLSPTGTIHLLDNPSPNKSTWFTLCGRKLRRNYALADETFDSGSECCNCCIYQSRKIIARKAC